MKVDMNAIIDAAPDNQIIQNTLMKMDLKLDHYRNPVCSVSGGSDSDTMIDLIERVRGDRPMAYVFFNTGIEYRATLRHLDELEAKYGIRIERRDATVPVPVGCQEYGLPFLSKEVSEYIGRLQRHGFQWEDGSLEELCDKYQDCRSSLRWWCNEKSAGDGGESRFNIGNAAHLKEFLIAYPPQFHISGKCCDGAKKNPSGVFCDEIGANMKVIGLRRAEGGIRAGSFTSCFSIEGDGPANYRPLWFWTDEMKAEYKTHYGVIYSDCYEAWGFKRTGCAGCPFNSRFEDEIKIIEQHEPLMARACKKIFGPSYEYTRRYRAFRDEMKAKKKAGIMDGQEEIKL